jgi:hypothetical protein
LLKQIKVVTPRSLFLAAVGLTAVAAAAAGGFLALRMNGAEEAIATVGAPNPPAPSVAEDAKLPGPPSQTPAPRTPARTATPTAVNHPRVVPPPPPALDPPPAGSPDPAPVAAPVTPVPVAAPPATEVTATAAPPVADSGPVQIAPRSPRFEELVLDADTVIGIRLESTLSSQNAHVEDKVTAVVTRDVTVADRTVIPAGTMLDGIVQSVEAGGKFKTQARLGIRFNRVLMPDNSRVPIQTEAIFREGEPPANEAVATVGASAVVGSILGALIGGKKGAAIGAGAGAAGGTAVVAAKDPNAVVMASGTLLTVRLTAAAKFTIQRDVN